MATLVKLLAGFGILVLALFVLASLLVLGEVVGTKVARRWRRWRARHGGGPAPSTRTLTLLVNVDRTFGRLHPSVQILGRPLERETFVRLELVDRRGRVQLILGRRISRRAIGTEVPLPSFSPPFGLETDQVLGWRWDVILGDAKGELERWQEHPTPAGRPNVEAEVDPLMKSVAGPFPK